MKKALLPLLLLASLSSQAQTTGRVPLFEVFTSSTCPPCKPGNTIYEGVVNTKSDTAYVSVKYQQNFPGSGDPYGTIETVNRRNYYGVTGIPNMQIDGGWNQNAQSFSNSVYNQYKAVPATYKLAGSYTVTNKKVTARAIFTPLTAGTGAKLYVAVIEKKTVLNVKNNGETEFINVVKKMIPTETGIDVSAVGVNTQKSITQSYTFPDSNRLPSNYSTKINLATENSVEDFNNLRVVAWIQGSDKKVYQAANLSKSSTPLGVEQAAASTLNSFKVFPVPAANNLNVEFDMKEADEVSVTLVSMTGATVASKASKLNAGKNQVSFDTQNLATGSYTIIIMDSKDNVQAQLVSVAH